MKSQNRTRGMVLTAAVLGLMAQLLLAAPANSTALPGSSCVVAESGDLKELIETIVGDHTPGQDSNGMVVPTAEQTAAWETMLGALARGDLDSACTTLLAHGFPYQLVHLTDTAYGDETYWVLRENWPISAGWGTYVVRAAAASRELVIEVPHPHTELHTHEEGVDLLRQLDARALTIAGTHRCANTTYSPCPETTTICGQEEPFRTSDAAHTTQTMFQAAHRALVLHATERVAIQLHGCDDADCPDLFISNGTCTPGEQARRLAARAAEACGQEYLVGLADCAPGECSLVGTTHAQGRYSNQCDQTPCQGCPDPADPPNPEQFLHLEQQHAFRDDYACLITALKRTFPYSVYTPALAEGTTPAQAGSSSAQHRLPSSGGVLIPD